MNKQVYTNFWKKIGATHPYFGVLTHPEYRVDELDAETKAAFFHTGKKTIDRTAKMFNTKWPQKGFNPVHALDFGCGAGRLSLALSPYCQQVTGVDVSAAMLAEATKNGADQQCANVRFELIPDRAPFLTQQYDYVQAHLVFQHIPPANGLLLLDHLLSHLTPGGFVYFQLTYNNLSSPRNKFRQYISFTYPVITRFLLGQKDYAFPMFDYDLNAVFALFQRHGIGSVHQRFGISGKHQFVNLYAKKKPAPQP
jgi:SAM-dependent methyltransferase